MTITFDWEKAKELKASFQPILERIVDLALHYVKCPYETEVNVVMTDDEEIHRVNQEFRKIDRATDVLSFPMVDYIVPGDFSHLEEYGNEYFHPESGELLLGDIMISVETAERQAREYGHSLEREIAFLTVHSMLHLCGYDHIEEEERIVMEEKQREIMEIAGIAR